MTADSDYRVAWADEVDAGAWDRCVDESDDAWLWHRKPFLRALTTWRGYSDRSFAVLDRAGDVVALHPLHVVRKPSWRPSPAILDSQGGLAVSNGVSPKVRRRISEAAMSHLEAVASTERAISVRVAVPPLAPANRPGRRTVNPLLELGLRNTQTQTWVVRLDTRPLEGRYSSNARQDVRKATEAVKVRVARPADLDVYYELHVATYRATGAPPHPYDYFKHIFEHFVPHGLARVLLAERDGRVVAAQNSALDKGAGLYWTGASDPTARAGENRLLGHLQLMRCQAEGYGVYDMGEAFPGAAGKTRGLSDFKRSFGGELHPYFRGTLAFRPWLELAHGTLRSVLLLTRPGR